MDETKFLVFCVSREKIFVDQKNIIRALVALSKIQIIFCKITLCLTQKQIKDFSGNIKNSCTIKKTLIKKNQKRCLLLTYFIN